MTDFLLTIGIPNYNWWEYLRKTIESCYNILDLWEDEFQVLVSDNCSTDNSLEIVKELQQNHHNIKLVQQKENVGRVWNWNKILELSDWKCILIMMVWDTINKISICEDLAYILKGNHIAYSYSTKENWIIKHLITWVENKEKKMFYNPCIIHRSRDWYVWFLQSTIINREIIDEFQIKFNQELEYFADVLFYYQYFLHIKNFIYKNSNIYCKDNDKFRASYYAIISWFYDSIKMFNIIYLWIKKRSKYYAFILSTFIAMYIKNIFVKSLSTRWKNKLKVRDIVSFVKKIEYKRYEIFLWIFLIPIAWLYYILEYRAYKIPYIKKIIYRIDDND